MIDTRQRQFDWLKFMGLEETKRYFNIYGMSFGLEWWDLMDRNDYKKRQQK